MKSVDQKIPRGDSRRGLTLVEVMVSIVVMGIGVVVLAQLVTQTSRQVQVGLDESSLLKTLDSLETQVVADSLYTAPIDAVLDPTDFSSTFESSTHAELRCYNNTMGQIATTDPDNDTIFTCPEDDTRYELRYFKLVETDTSIAGTEAEMAKLPLYRYHFRVKYGKDLGERIEFSRLIVGVLPY